MSPDRYVARNSTSRLYWNGSAFFDSKPMVTLDAEQLAYLCSTFANVHGIKVKVVRPLPEEIKEAYRRYQEASGPYNVGSYDRTHSQNVSFGMRSAKLWRLIRKHGLNEAATLNQLVNPEIHIEATESIPA
jgi:hypothetical protein